ncbi:MAG TPA: hypothetical protein VFJ57_07760 [Solirubrobacterales bacterium]|nr:hypothetical protein [Solirubrobacterales bacterium]
MPERLRALLDHPLDPSAARAILTCATAILIALAAIFALAGGGSEPGQRSGAAASREGSPRPPASPAGAARPQWPEGRRRDRSRRQDPQDRDGSPAARRAASALRSHRALQHVPYRRGGLTVSLVGARRGRAVLRVTAPSFPAARRGWLAFLDRFHDAGRAYVVRLRGRRGGDG